MCKAEDGYGAYSAQGFHFRCLPERCKNFAISNGKHGRSARLLQEPYVCVRFALGFALFLAISRKADFFMSLRTSLLRTLENPQLSVNDRVELCCEVTRKLENRGEYVRPPHKAQRFAKQTEATAATQSEAMIECP